MADFLAEEKGLEFPSLRVFFSAVDDDDDAEEQEQIETESEGIGEWRNAIAAATEDNSIGFFSQASVCVRVYGGAIFVFFRASFWSWIWVGPHTFS